MTAARALQRLLAGPGPAAGTVAVAESITAGHLQAAIAAVPGASRYFLGGITAYTLDGKVRHLGVARAPAAAVNSVAARVAEEMARGVTRLFMSRYGVATTGYAEPDASRRVPAPFAWWAVAERRGRRVTVRSGRVEFPGASRVRAQQLVAAAVLRELVAFVGRDAGLGPRGAAAAPGPARSGGSRPRARDAGGRRARPTRARTSPPAG